MTATPIAVRTTVPGDFPGIFALTRAVYPDSLPWTVTQLDSHYQLFLEGQLVAVSADDGALIGMAASLIVLWDEYHFNMTWRDMTSHGTSANHDPARGRTLYGAEVMVHPAWQGKGVGSALYREREALVRRLALLRIRAGARLRGYARVAADLSAEEHVMRVVRGERVDRTLTFQLRRGLRVLAVSPGYLRNDPVSLGYAAVIEWLNPDVATAAEYAAGDPRFRAGGAPPA